MSDTRVFPASRKKAVMLLLGSMVFVVLGNWLRDEHPFLGWITIAFFGLGIPASLAMLLPNRVYLKLDRDGFELGTPWRRSRTRWTDVDGFAMAELKGTRMIAIVYRAGYEEDRLLRRTSEALGGIEGGIANNYRSGIEEVMAALQEWHARHGTKGA